MRIDPRFASMPVAAPSAGQRAHGERFALEREDAPRSGAARSAAPLATLDAILALQGEEDPAERRRRGARSGRDVLDALDALKAALLGGSVPAATLAGIAGRLAALDRTGDPGLDDVLAQIDLRARVELAKLGRSA